ncbi:hypothetical protein DPMN_184258 [Dreissena polymorpha]|uniref:Uncharacterized protein n=1 Tax=Dreissena polymorpha TaxID=45954 RepID=A0A9D4DIW6_DREPO|nr:hypothetical protein DPMN_184258 [Dreissena polymorpha]
MIIDCKATVRRPYYDLSTSCVRLLRPQNDYDVRTATSCVLTASIATLLRLWRSYCDPSAPLGTYKGRREDAQNAINQDAGVTRRQKTAFLPKKSLASLLRQSEISRKTVLGRRKDAVRCDGAIIGTETFWLGW